MSVVAGCDVGSLTSKAVIMKEGRRILAADIIRSCARPEQSAEEVMNSALEKAGLSMKDIDHCTGTGYGRGRISFINEEVSEISCHGKGASWLVPSARTVIDIGGQDCKAMKLDNMGKVVKFTANDKCASGTGRFLEVMAKVLDVDIEVIGLLSSKTNNPVMLSSTCTVWAQADVIKFVNSGYAVEDIAAGINKAMANRVSILINSIGLEPYLCMTGGVAKNQGVVSSLEKLLGCRIKSSRKADPQLAGAIGAAIYSYECFNGGQK